MTNFKHLTATELLAYSLGSLEKNESQTLGRHLLTCAECRKLLPMPSAERFWAAVMTDAAQADAPEKGESENLLSSLYSFLKFNYGLVWGGAALIIVLGFSFLLWSGSAETGREVVQTFDNELISDPDFSLPSQFSVKDNSADSANSNRVVAVSSPKNLKPDSPKPKISQNNPGQDSRKPGLKQTNEIISATRGVSAKCGEKQTIQVEFSADKENFVFRWKAVPKAAKYHLYISDDEEILIDEFETERETSYTLKKPLDPTKIYKWKVVVTTEDGKTIVGDSQKFTSKDSALNRNKSERKEKSQIRCTENN